ncbi:unnamed protein product [Pedinophyceae sp. YPF-701]|nr:unnamed protein product [Pedinophyceae sp. YPF-701]
MPSVVSYLEDGSVVVGEEAKRLASRDPANTFYSVKRFLGRDRGDPAAEEDIRRVAYSVDADEDGCLRLVCPNVEGGFLYPEEVSAHVLDALLNRVEEAKGFRPTKAVIGVPAYFTEEAREATEQAGLLAGLEVVRLVHEPVAAALAYGLDLKEDQTVMVFDLGGGTYDISVLEVGNGVIEVLATGGDAHLGGDDWDAALAQWISRNELKPRGVDVESPRIRANVRKLAEMAKIQLTDSAEVVLRMPVGPGGEPVSVRITRQLLEEASVDLFRRARLAIDAACWQAGVDLGASFLEGEVRRGKRVAKSEKLTRTPRSKGDGARRQPISEVLLVGGATRMPAIARFVRNMTGVEPRGAALVDPDQAVALGAAVQAGIFQGEVEDLMVMSPWKAALMRAFARRAIEGGALDDMEWEDSDDDGEGGSDGEGAGGDMVVEDGDGKDVASKGEGAGAT